MSQPMAIPTVPPRPARVANRSMSPSKDAFAPSPLGQGFSGGAQLGSSPGLYSLGQDVSSSSLPQRPPSVSLPSIGQEGNEYAGVCHAQPETPEIALSWPASPRETRNVGEEVQLHAPKPALPTSSAKARIATVTRTDSQQAAAAGIGKPHGDDHDPHARPLKARSSFASQGSSASTERPSSAQPGESEQGIPEIGQRVPMYPNAGDVQAPSPSPFAQTAPSGIGFHNDGQHRAGRHHGRTRSGKEQLLPPGSYGLHGHGTPVQDRFEKAWYEKHPDALEREEHGEYGPGIGGGRGEWALSSDDLNKIVRDTASRGSGLGTSPAVASTPHEQIGYLASEEYALRMASARSPPSSYHNKAHSNSSLPHLESPLRKASFPNDGEWKDNFQDPKSSAMGRRQSENALESEAEDDIIHVDPPSRAASKIGGGGYDPPTEDLGPHGGNTDEEGGWIDEQGYGTPILASDEVAKEKGAEFLQPAVEPHQERRASEYYVGIDTEHAQSHSSGYARNGSRASSAAGSRPTSRPGSAAGTGTFPGLSRFTSVDERDEIGTPLEDVEEYEPLFPEDEASSSGKASAKRPWTAADRLKRPNFAKHKFPSQDIWEDTPSSVHLQATVSTPDLQEEEAKATAEAESKAPAEETLASGQQDEGDEAEGSGSLRRDVKDRTKPHLPPHLREEAGVRQNLRQRFPSRDIWEDSPASLQLQTTVTTPQVDELKSPPTISDRPDDVGAERAAGKTTDASPTSGTRPIEKPENIRPRAPAPETADAGPLTESASQPRVPPRPQRDRQVQPSKVVPAAGMPPMRADDGIIEPQSSPVAGRKPPVVPDRPKPQVPIRPAKLVGRDSSEEVPLSKTTSATSTTSPGGVEEAGSPKTGAGPPTPKPKPAVPMRPSGGKLASLKAGFLSDLDKRLQIGPQGPKVKDKGSDETENASEKEVTPLTDARKGRARGPARRRPAASPSGGAEATPTLSGTHGKLELSSAILVWRILDDGDVEVAAQLTKAPEPEATKAPDGKASPLATNMAGERIDEVTVPDGQEDQGPDTKAERSPEHRDEMVAEEAVAEARTQEVGTEEAKAAASP
ncbi:MAG: hypothetical protein M1832_001622 [Thelocarpon impressellum]|nr:MAG: hypothetical protein M1832_001622 [Thelocarpon impressellum]